MPKRRQYGTGSVYQRDSDDRWIGTIEAGFTRSGARRRVTVTAKTEAECKRKLRDKRLAIERDGMTDASDRMTVKGYGVEWMERQATRLRPKTYSAYTGSMKWIVETVGAKRLSDLTPRDVRSVANAQRRAGLSSTTALHTHAVLTRMLRAAQLDGYRIPASVLLVERPQKAVNDRTDIPLPDALALLEVAFTLPHRSRWFMALLSGLRRGECLGLTWPEVDLDAGTAAISWQLQALPYLDKHDRGKGFQVPDGYESRHLKGAWHLVRPKTKHSWRVIPLVGPLVPMLREWQRDGIDSPHGLVWPATDGGPPDTVDDLDEWKALQVTAGVGHPNGRFYVLHEARNTTATLLLAARVPNEVITAVLGHSSIVVSRGYMTVNQDQAREAMERVAGMLQLPS